MRTKRSLQIYRDILESEPEETNLYAYHAYGDVSALIYDVLTTIASVLNGQDAQPRSRFRFNDMSVPYKPARDFLEHEEFKNDHKGNFTPHGISAVPHLFSSSCVSGESPLSGLQWRSPPGNESGKALLASLGLTRKIPCIDK